jgi:hypothetical protein
LAVLAGEGTVEDWVEGRFHRVKVLARNLIMVKRIVWELDQVLYCAEKCCAVNTAPSRPGMPVAAMASAKDTRTVPLTPNIGFVLPRSP